MNDMFSNQVVVITGATRGIGKAIAEAFETQKVNLILTGTKEKDIHKLNSISNPKTKWFCVDFNDENKTNEFIIYLKNRNRIDVLINNAGINYIENITEFPLQKFDEIINVNLRIPFRLMQAVIPKMIDFRYGKIINIASILGNISMPKRSAYSASKSGLIGMSKSIALEVAKYNVLVNCVSPGIIKTDLTKTILPDSEIQNKSKIIPMKRLAKSKELTGLILYLSSKENSYITGENIKIDGGYTAQ